MGHFSMEIDAPNGSNLSGNQHVELQEKRRQAFSLNCMSHTSLNGPMKTVLVRATQHIMHLQSY
jgi:hypothetical protein